MNNLIKKNVTIVGIGCVLLGIIPVFFYLSLMVFFNLVEVIPPGVKIGDIQVDWMTRSEAIREVDSEYNYRRTLQISSGNQVWSVPPIEFGFYVEPSALVDRALAEGKGLAAPLGFLIGWIGPELVIEPRVLFSEKIAYRQVEQWGLIIGYPAESARIEVVQGKWKIIAGQPGLMIDLDRTMKTILNDPESIYWKRRLELLTQPIPPSDNGNLKTLTQLMNQLNQPLKVKAYDPILDQEITDQIPAKQFTQFVKVHQKNGEYHIAVNTEEMIKVILSWQWKIGQERELAGFPSGDQMERLWREGKPLELTVRHKPTQYIVQPGDTLTSISFKVGIPYWKILEANPGLQADQVSLGQKLVIPSKNDLLPLPVVRGKRIVINISKQRMWTFENGVRKKEYVVSSGIDRSPTMPGVFQVRTHEISAYASVWDLYMPHFLGIYEAWPGFMNGIHGLPTLSNGTRLWANVLGRKASYGCIILSLEAAREVYEWADNGVVVVIEP